MCVMMKKLYGAIEAGGTKFRCCVGYDKNIVDQTSFPTSSPVDTFEKIHTFFSIYKNELQAIGVASFGPIDLDPHSETYGYIMQTPKPFWSHTDFIGELKRRYAVPCAFDTDVNAAVLAEARWGAASGLQNAVYITIGTGVGGGVISGGRLVHGLVHPELGHMLLRKRPDDDFAGVCPFHQDNCFEGLCSGPAIEARWGVSGVKLQQDHPAWELQAHYIAEALVSVICVLSPERIVLGGGVMAQPGLLARVRTLTRNYLNNYVQHPQITARIEQYIVAPGLGENSGLLGALCLAQQLGEDP